MKCIFNNDLFVYYLYKVQPGEILELFFFCLIALVIYSEGKMIKSKGWCVKGIRYFLLVYYTNKVINCLVVCILG